MTNFPSIQFSEADLSKINSALLTLEEAFAGKLFQAATPAAPVDPLKTDIENLAAFPAEEIEAFSIAMPAFANITQWSSDEKTREQLNPIAIRLKQIAQQVVYTNRAVLQRCWDSSTKY